MSAKMSGFANAKLWGGDYLFLLVAFNDFATDRSAAVRGQLDAFGARLGAKGWVVSAFERASLQAENDLRSKQWPNDVFDQLFDGPDAALLVIDKDFSEFDPRSNRWAVIWFADHDPNVIYRLFNEIANKVRHEEDLFAYLSSVGRKGRFRRFSRYFELKPGFLGMSINANAIFEDLAAQPV